MRLTRLRIENLRCIDSLEFCLRDYTTLIGPNNAGKSTVLRAIELFLSQSKPDPDEWRKGFEDRPIVIQAEFGNIAAWERAKPGVSSLVHDNRILLRYIAKCEADDKGKMPITVEYEASIKREEIDGWSDSWADLSEPIKKIAITVGIANGNAFKPKAAKETVRQAIRDTCPALVTIAKDAEWTSEGISINAALQQAIPQVASIPAVRSAEDDGKPGAKTSFGLLMKQVILPAVTASKEYETMVQAVRVLESRLRGEGVEQLEAVRQLSDEISSRLSNLISARASIGMDPPDAEKFIGSNTVLRLDDGVDTRIALQGNGLQRALVFALLEVLAAQSAARVDETNAGHRRSTLLLFEEPELFIHPHLMRRLLDVLRAISGRPDWQVVATTHSPFLVDVATDPQSLVIHRRPKPSEPPCVTQLAEDPFAGSAKSEDRERLRAVLDFHPTVCEAFFAKRTTLVEGDTELATLIGHEDLFKLARLDEGFARDVTVVACGGKWTIIPIAILLRKFGVPLRVIHDKDQKGKTSEELELDPKHPFNANVRIEEAAGKANVLVIDDTFEHVLWTREEAPKSGKDKPYRAWKRVKELLNDAENLDHCPDFRDAVGFAFGNPDDA